MTFNEAIATQPLWIQYWINTMGVVFVVGVLVLLCSAATRRDALFLVLSLAATALAMMWLYGQVGYVRLLGIIHVIFWTPLAIYLWKRLSDSSLTAPFRQVIWLVLAVMMISLAFDVVDVARYALGERESLIPSQT